MRRNAEGAEERSAFELIQEYYTSEDMNWKYILIIIILAVIVSGGILTYQYWWLPREEAKISGTKPPEVKVPEEIPADETSDWKAYIPEDWRITEKTEGNLNKDNLTDIAVIIEQGVQNLSLGKAAPRKLLIILQKGNGTYELSIQSDKAILRANEGGVFGDPLEGLLVDKGSLLIEFYGGSNWRWAQTFRFRYQDNGWYLIGVTLTNYYTGTGEGTIEDYNLSTGKMKKTTGKILRNVDEVGKTEEKWIDRGKKELLNLKDFDPRLTEKKF